MRIESGQSPFVVSGRQDAGNSDETMICVVGSVLRWTDWIIGATTSIVADSGNLGLSVSVVSCNLDCGRIGSWNGLLVDEAKASTSNSDVVRIDTLLSDCRLENVTGAAPNRHANGGSKLWSQRLLSNSISKSSSVLSGTVIRDFNDGGDLLCSNNTFTSCSTSTVRPMTRRHKSKDGRYEWQDAAFGTGTLFDFYDYSSDGEDYYIKGANFFFSTCDDTIHFTRCNFANIDGTDPTDEDYRGEYGTAILVRCHSSLLVDECHFSSCTSQLLSGAIHVEMDSGDPSVLVNSSTFEECSSAKAYQPSILYFYSFGSATLSSSVFTGNMAVRNDYIVQSDSLIASSCSFDYDSVMNQRAIRIEAFPTVGVGPAAIEIDSATSVTGFVSQSIDHEILLHPSDFHLGDIVRSLPQKKGLTVKAESMLDAPIVVKPLVVKSWVIFDGELSHDRFPRYHFVQDTSEKGILITILDSASFEFHAADILVDSLNTEAMVKVDKKGDLRIMHSIIRGDDGQPTRPFLQSQGQIYIDSTHFISMTMSGHSCIEMNGGNLEIYSEPDIPFMSSAINLTTTGSGAFLSATNSPKINMTTVFFVNCSAQSGGALSISDSPTLTTKDVRFIGCSAREDGGGVRFVDETGIGSISLALECVNCTARRGGGLFMLLGDETDVVIEALDTVNYFWRYFQIHAFENCIAEQGSGMFVDGNCRLDSFTQFDLGFNNWNTEGLGTDICFGESVIIEDVDSFVADIQSSCRSMSRQSIDTSKLCHVHIAGSTPPRSFNLPFPKVMLSGSGSDMISPLVEEEVSHFFEIAQYVHHKDEDGNNLKTDIILQSSFYLSERGYCTDQFFSFISDPDEEDPDPVHIRLDGSGPLEEHVVLEIGADARVEFHNLILLVLYPVQMMLLTDASAEGLVERCSFWYDPTPDPLLVFNVALFEVVDGTLTLKNTIFTLEGDAADFGPDDFFVTRAPFVLVSPSISPSASPTVIMDNMPFERMRLGEGVEALMVFDVSASVSVNDLKFVHCNQTEGVETTRIVVTGRNLERMDTSKWTGFSFLTLSDTLNWGIDTSEGSGSIWRVVPLRVVLTHFTNTTIKTEESGKDMIGCGEGEWSCRGLVRAGKNVGGDTGCTITVVGSTLLDGVFDPATKLTSVKSSSSQSTIIVSKEGVILNSPDGGQAPILTLSHLSFSLPPSLDSDSLMKSLGGELKIDNCWFVCSSVIDYSLVSATGGIATITELSLSSDLRFSNSAFSFYNLSSAKFHTFDSTAHFDVALISAKGTPTGRWKLTITQSSIKGSETERNEEHDEKTNLCAWESGAIELEDVNCEVSWTTLSHLGQGAMHAWNSNVTFQQAILTNNGISTGLFPSARQNIRCVGSSRISFETSAMGTGEGRNQWVSGDKECVVEGVVGEERQLFFEPTLDSNLSSSTLHKKEKKYEVLIVGTTLIPCGLSLEVFENGKSSTNRVFIPLSEIASEWNETSLSLVIPATRLSSLSNTPQWLGRISFGGQHTTDSFEMKLSAKMARANEMKKTLPWLIPLIVVLSLLLIVGIILFVLCRRRKQKLPTNMSEMQPQEPIEDEKIEVFSEDTVTHAKNSAASTIHSHDRDLHDARTLNHNETTSCVGIVQFNEFVEALTCAGKMEMAVVRKQDTLYARLHTEQGRKVALTKESVRRQLLRGIQKIWETDKHAPILTKLSSHVVMVDFASNVFLNINSDGTTLGENGRNKEATLLEQKRWSAPELDVENGTNAKGSEKEIDSSKAAVFSLGLILWELETGLVPFGEVDAMNAQRQLGVGSTLKMEGIKDSAMKEAISQCISTNPDDRPTLAELNELINPKKDFPPLPSNCSDS
ncbi:hypothetical protein BLNAU_12310 [Blattamonas nauphoetae]|uniref:Protein kinase domain-containing protein n=1 Tax=Blattamonas nauphoetae TaxID=2049346 RepID=A0ABQ9XQT5_9EUKA|nr:hypothetical protein BLNAU_12310 [Blattamonas nauphoetae]